MQKSILNFALLALVFGSSLARANHVKINCGPAGFWDQAAQKAASGFYVWIMSDDTAQYQNSVDEHWIQAGAVKFNEPKTINAIELAQFNAGDAFSGDKFKMTLGQEFTRPNQKPDRRFFRASFVAHPNGGKAISGELECAAGLK